MRIIFLEAAQNFGGSKRSFVDLAKSLKDMGYDVLFVDLWGANKEFNSAIHDNNLSYKILDPASKPFILGSRNLIKRFLFFFIYFFKRFSYKRKFRKVVESFKPSHVCVNSVKTLDILDANSMYNIDYYARGWGIGDSKKNNFIMRRYRVRFIAISEAARHAIYLQQKIPLNKIELLKVAVDKKKDINIVSNEDFQFGMERPMELLHAGTFTKLKGHHVSLLIAKALRDKGIYFNLTVAGLISLSPDSLNYLKSLQDFVKVNGLSDCVNFVINKHDLSLEMKKADVFVFPSYTEGLSRVCLEAMSYGKPVVANPVGGIVDFVINGYSGYLVNFNDVNQYADRIFDYYKDADLYRNHSINSISIVESGYLPKHFCDAIRRIYPKVE